MSKALNWVDATTATPPEESLFMVVEDRAGKRIADIVTGFYAEGEFHVGTTTTGDPMSSDWIVCYWALAVWPDGYDGNGIWQGKESK